MTIWSSLTATIWRLLDQHSQLMAFVLLLLEESGVPPLIPGDLLMVLVGVRAAQGRLHLLEALLVLEAATVLGGSILYWLSAFGGHAVIERVGRHVGATPERLRRASEALERHGEWAIVLGRLIPSLCILTAVAAGLLELPYRRFLPALALGGFLHLLLFVMLGYYFGPPVLRVLALLHPSTELIGALLGLVAVVAWLVWAARRTPPTPLARLTIRGRLYRGLLAGLVGALVATLLAVISLQVGGLFAQRWAIERLIATDLVQNGPIRALAIVITMIFLVASMLWGAIYGLVEPWLVGPAWLRGLIFAAIPLAFSLLVAFPLAGGGLLGRDLGEGLLPALGELVRALAYGLILGAAYPVLVPHRARKVMA
jgi:membrane protein DedA with SNARE-associated domain